MRKLVFLCAVLTLICINPAFAKDEKKNTPVAAPQSQPTPAQQEKEALIANINNLRNQELRAAVLQQLLNEEIAKMRNIQAVFCDQYKLDVEKFRNGLYRYDEKQGKFVEAALDQPKR